MSKDGIRRQIRKKQQEAEAWSKAFKSAKDPREKSAASQNYMIASQELKQLRALAKTLDVELTSEKVVKLDVKQELSKSPDKLLNKKPTVDAEHEKRLVADFEYFCSHLEITYRPGLNPDHPEGGFGPFILAEGQKKLAALMIQVMLIERRPLRLVILKSRQLGCTTFLLAFWVWILTRISHFHVFFMIDVGKHAETKRRMMIKWIESLNKRWPHLFSEIQRGGKKAHMLMLSNESILFIDSAESTNPGTSEMLHVLHTSEKPKWVKGRARQIKESVEPALPSSPMTANVDESTACGLEDFYYKWRLATTDKDAGIIPVFLPWHITTECQLPVTEDFEYSDRIEFADIDPKTNKTLKEVEYAAKYSLTKEQIMWRRWAILTKFEGNRQSFDQEHPTTPGHAFRQFSNHFFGKATRNLSQDKSNFTRGYLEDLNGNSDPRSMVNWAEVEPSLAIDSGGPLFIREMPKKGGRYYIGVDVAEGKTVVDQKGKNDPDYTVMSVKDSQGKTVAIWLGRIPPEEAWLPLLLLAIFYNRAHVNGERNNHGYTLLVFFWRTAYGYNLVEPEPRGRKAKERAWTLLTGSTLREDMLKQLRSLYSRYPGSMFNFHGHEESLNKQLENFIKGRTAAGKTKYVAASGFHDDIILAEAHAYRCVAFYEGDSVYEYVNDGKVEAKPLMAVETRQDSGPTLADTEVGDIMTGISSGRNGYSLDNYSL